MNEERKRERERERDREESHSNSMEGSWMFHHRSDFGSTLKTTLLTLPFEKHLCTGTF